MTSTVPFSRLLLEEARALPRGRFALAGAAVLAGLLVLMGGVVATAIDGLWSFALLAYGIVPALLAGFCAAQMASLRATRFGQALYTSPVRSRQVLAARVVLGFALGAAYLVATIPFLLVASLHVEVASHVILAFYAGVGIVAFCVSLGTMLGVLLAGRSIAAPSILAGGFVLLSFFAMTYTMTGLAFPGGLDPAAIAVMHVSPHLQLADAVGLFSAYAGVEAAAPGRALALFALETIGCLAVAAWAYVRKQGPEGWESPRASRAVLAAIAVALLVAPAAVADATYERTEDHQRSGRGWSTEERNATILLVEPGARTPAFGDRLAGTQRDPLDIGRANARDLLILLSVEEGRALRDVLVTVEPGAKLDVQKTRFELGDIETPERGDVDRDGARATWPRHGGAVLRVPVALTPRDALDLTSNAYTFWVNVTYGVDGESDPRNATVRGGLRGDVPWVKAQMALAGAPLLLLTSFAAVSRRTRVG